MEISHCGRYSMAQWVTNSFSSDIVTCKCLFHWIIGLFFCYIINTGPSRGSSSWIYCCCPLQWRVCSFRFAGLVPSNAPSDRRCGGWHNESTHCSGSGSGCWIGQTPALLHPQCPGQLFSTDPASSPFVASKRKPSSFSYSRVLGFNWPSRVSITVLPINVYGSLCLVLQLERGTVPALPGSWPQVRFTCATTSKVSSIWCPGLVQGLLSLVLWEASVEGQGGHLFPAHATWEMRSWTSSPTLMLSKWSRVPLPEKYNNEISSIL